MANAIRLPRRRSSAAPGIGSLEAESAIQDGGKRRQRIPLQRIAAMPIDAGIGTLPFAREAVLGVARLLDHEGLKPEPEPLLLPLRHQVLAQRTRSRFGSELDEAPARRHRDALDRLHGFRGRDRRQPGALAGHDPAAVDEDVELLAAFELQRCQHVIAGSTVQHLVVEEERRARNEPTARADAPALEGGRLQSHRGHRKHRALGRFVEPAAELEFLFGAILASLGSALFFLVTDGGQSKRTVKALALRVGLSLTLFLLLMAGYYFGLIPGKIS